MSQDTGSTVSGVAVSGVAGYRGYQVSRGFKRCRVWAAVGNPADIQMQALRCQVSQDTASQCLKCRKIRQRRVSSGAGKLGAGR